MSLCRALLAGHDYRQRCRNEEVPIYRNGLCGLHRAATTIAIPTELLELDAPAWFLWQAQKAGARGVLQEVLAVLSPKVRLHVEHVLARKPWRKGENGSTYTTMINAMHMFDRLVRSRLNDWDTPAARAEERWAEEVEHARRREENRARRLDVDQVLVDTKRALEACFPDRADRILHEIERRMRCQPKP